MTECEKTGAACRWEDFHSIDGEYQGEACHDCNRPKPTPIFQAWVYGQIKARHETKRREHMGHEIAVTREQTNDGNDDE